MHMSTWIFRSKVNINKWINEEFYFILFLYLNFNSKLLRCEENIDECKNNACYPTGTKNCTDLINGYRCDCNQGYEG